MWRFVAVNFRCHDCNAVLRVEKPTKIPCPRCQQVYDFSFLATITKKKKVKGEPRVRVIKLPDPPIGPLEDEIRVVQIRNRHVGMVKRRMRVVMILKDRMHYSFSHIGRTIDRNHASVIHLYRRAKILMIESPEPSNSLTQSSDGDLPKDSMPSSN